MMTTAIVSREDNEAFVFMKWDDASLEERMLDALANGQTTIIRAGAEHFGGLLGWSSSDLDSIAPSPARVQVQGSSFIFIPHAAHTDGLGSQTRQVGLRVDLLTA